MLIIATYQRMSCNCGWKRQITINDFGWETPTETDDERDEGFQGSVHSFQSSIQGSLHGTIQGTFQRSISDYFPRVCILG